MRYLLFLSVIYVLLHNKDLHASEAEKRLVKHLFNESNHNKVVRPVENSSDALNVSVGLAIHKVAEFIEMKQEVDLSVWLKMEWHDYQLKWDPAKFDGIRDINVPPKDVWLPDLVLYNNIHDDNAEYGRNMDVLKTRIKLRHTGDLLWVAPLFLKAKCSIKVDDFPFDTQACYLKIGSWTYPVTAVNLISKGVDTTAVLPGVEWNLKSVGSTYNFATYQCCPGEVYPDIDFHLTFERISLFYATNFIFPMVLITALSILTFMLPNESETTPNSCENLPLLIHYFIFCLLMIFAIIVLLCCISRMYNRGRTEKPMSQWMRRWILDYLSHKLCIQHPKDGNDLTVPKCIEKKLIYDNKESKMTGSRHGETAAKRPKLSSVFSAGSGYGHKRLHGDQDKNSITMEEEWRVVAMTIDYMLFIGFVITFLIGTAATFGGAKYFKSLLHRYDDDQDDITITMEEE